MQLNPKIKLAIYGVIVFIVFITLTQILKIVTHQFPTDFNLATLFPQKDLILGALVAAVLTFSHYRKKKLK